MRRRNALFALAAATTSARGGESQALPPRPGTSLRMVMTEFPPYTGTNLPGGGVATAITRAVLARQGLAMSAEVRPWARALSEAQLGLFDGLIGVWRNPARERVFSFTHPLGIVNRIGFMARAGTTFDVSDLRRLRALNIGAVNGYANPQRVEEAQLKLDPAVDDLHNLRKLLAKRIDLALVDRGVARYLLRTQLHDSANALVWLEPAVAEIPLFSAFPSRSPNAQQHVAAFNASLREMKVNGQLDLLLKASADWL